MALSSLLASSKYIIVNKDLINNYGEEKYSKIPKAVINSKISKSKTVKLAYA